ncbi:MAG TPA: RNA polymerase sigma-70 factor [Bryobacteraceae bacterium]|nr:RNA polymerase sigma-70 factor [Bryobacteraceae bacterium]
MRSFSFSIAYRMLGSVADAEDVVQETFLRLHNTVRAGTNIESPKAFVATVTTRLAIDHLRSARVQREAYIGTWLPEPVIGAEEPVAKRRTEMAESLSMAFLAILETLSPVERAVFLLREVFEYDYDEISRIVDKSEDNCRQLFVRAKRHLEVRKPRFEASREKRDELAKRFFEACERGELTGLVDLLASDVTFYGDGGGKATAIPHPLVGSDRVARFLKGLFEKGKQIGVQFRKVTVNGEPGALFFDSQNRLISVFALEIRDGRVVAIRSVVNPDKLQHLGPVSDLAKLPSNRSEVRG